MTGGGVADLRTKRDEPGVSGGVALAMDGSGMEGEGLFFLPAGAGCGADTSGFKEIGVGCEDARAAS